MDLPLQVNQATYLKFPQQCCQATKVLQSQISEVQKYCITFDIISKSAITLLTFSTYHHMFQE